MNLHELIEEEVRLQGVRMFNSIPDDIAFGMVYENMLMIREFSKGLIVKVKK